MEQARSVEWWFRDRYRLPPTDPRFLDLSRDDILLEYWTAHYAASIGRGGATFEDVDENFDLEAILAEAEGDDWTDVPELSHG